MSNNVTPSTHYTDPWPWGGGRGERGEKEGRRGERSCSIPENKQTVVSIEKQFQLVTVETTTAYSEQLVRK